MNYYIYQNEIFQFENKLIDGYLTSKDIVDKDMAFVEMNKNQINFYLNNQNASVQEVWNMNIQEAPPLSITQRRQMEYEIRIPRNMLEELVRYQLEGNYEKVQEIGEQIDIIKNQINEEIPDYFFNL